MTNKNAALWGSAVGLAAFLAIGLLPAMVYGGYAGVLLAGGIFGTPIQSTFAVRSLVVGGMVLGVMGVGSLFTVAGSCVGTLLGVLMGSAPPKAKTVKD